MTANQVGYLPQFYVSEVFHRYVRRQEPFMSSIQKKKIITFFVVHTRDCATHLYF